PPTAHIEQTSPLEDPGRPVRSAPPSSRRHRHLRGLPPDPVRLVRFQRDLPVLRRSGVRRAPEFRPPPHGPLDVPHSGSYRDLGARRRRTAARLRTVPRTATQQPLPPP